MKKVLIITYYWPPAGGIGVQRCLKFAKYLRNFGWEPVIYTAKNAQYSYFDDSGLKDLPEDIEILKRNIFEPFAIYKFLSGRKISDPVPNPIHVRSKKAGRMDRLAIWIRGNLFIPDARSFWIKPSVRYLSKYLKNHPVDAILSDGPPHTNTVIACRLSNKFKIPWLADFQDPWTQVDYYKLLKLTRQADRKHRELEQEAFRTAGAITIAGPTWKEDLKTIHAKNVHVVYWGYDEDDFRDIPVKPTNHFIISHSGLLGYDRNPKVFLQVIRDLITESPEWKEKIKLIFPGSVDYSVREEVKKSGLLDNTSFPGNLPRTDALEITLQSNLLLLPLNQAENAKGRIPGKLFENLRSQKPILCLGPEDSDVAGILSKTNHGKCFRYDDYQGIKHFIIKYLTTYINSGQTTCTGDVSEYFVKNQVQKVASLLNELIEK